MMRGAIISPCGLYRFELTREIDPHLCAAKRGTVLFVLNNPSTADAMIDDPTARRGWGYTTAWGYGRMTFGNTNPHRSTDPDAAIVPPEEILLENDVHLRRMASEAAIVIAAWGTKARPELADRALRVLSSVATVHALAFAKGGIPKHPLYLSGSLQPTVWKAA